MGKKQKTRHQKNGNGKFSRQGIVRFADFSFRFTSNARIGLAYICADIYTHNLMYVHNGTIGKMITTARKHRKTNQFV